MKESTNEAFLCLGGNLGNRLELLSKCRQLISVHCGAVVKESKIYETEAWGSDSEKKFLNQVILLQTVFTPKQLLKKLLKIESKLGRQRTENKNADRSIDIDILFFNNDVYSAREIEIPHPRLHLRRFVLKPLLDINPDFVHPVLKKSVRRMYKECEDQLRVTEYKLPKYICIEGNIGSGKSTLARAISETSGGLYLPELYENNDLLPLFYEDPLTYAFPLEFSFLLSRFQQINRAIKSKKSFVVADYSFYKCLWFARANLKPKEFELFRKQFEVLSKQLQKPDLVVFLDTSVKNLRENIVKRGRKYEQNIEPGYLEKIGKYCLSGLHELKDVPVLILPVKNYNQALNSALIKSIKKNTAGIL